MKKNQYKYIAGIYPHLMKHVNYPRWAEYLYEITTPHLSNKNPSILELAGGDGTLANLLSLKWKNIIVSDYSKEMLLLDKKNKTLKVVCDMTKLCFNKSFDIVILSFDSINYLLTNKSVLNFFLSVKNILADDGIFVFDASLKENSLLFSKKKEKWGIYNKIKYKHINLYDEKKMIHTNNFILYFGETEYYENHKQKIYPFEEYFKLLHKAGLYVVECFECFSFDDCTNESKRAQFIVKKVK